MRHVYVSTCITNTTAGVDAHVTTTCPIVFLNKNHCHTYRICIVSSKRRQGNHDNHQMNQEEDNLYDQQ